MAAKKTFPWCDKYSFTPAPEMTAAQRRANDLQVEWLKKAVEAQKPVTEESLSEDGHACANR